MSAADNRDALEPRAAAELDAFVQSHEDLDGPFDRVVGMVREYLPPRPVRRMADLTAMSARVLGREEFLARLAGSPEQDETERGVVEVASRIEACVVARRPGSFIRLSDGEGNLLALGSPQYPALTAHCVRQAFRKQLGGDGLSADEQPVVLAAVHRALRSADVIGVPKRGTLRWLLRRYPQVDVSGTFGSASVYRYLEDRAGDLALADKAASGARFSSDLLPYYRGLVEGRDVGLVSCHPQLPEALRARLGASSVTLHLVPGRAFSTPGDHRVRTSHYPERYLELQDELRSSARPGVLYLVAAGILAKVYCETIRAAGAVAVDIGAVADTWAGIRTRAYMDPAYLRAWSLVGRASAPPIEQQPTTMA